MKNIIPVGPRPLNSKPFIYKNRGMTVIGPARINNPIRGIFDIEKSFNPLRYIK